MVVVAGQMTGMLESLWQDRWMASFTVVLGEREVASITDCMKAIVLGSV